MTNPVVPAARAGMTLLFEEKFAADGWGPGWTATTNSGLVKGGINNGPTLFDGTANFRKCMAAGKKSYAVLSAGYTLPTAYYTKSAATEAICMSFWVRPSQHSAVNAAVARTNDNFANTIDTCSITCDSPERFRFEFTTHGSPTVAENSAWLPTGEWYLVWCAVEKAVGRCWFVRDKFGTVTRFARTTINALFAFQTDLRMGFFPPNTAAFQPGFSGQMAGFRVHQCDSWATACTGPTDWIWPTDGVTYSVDPSTGSDSNVNGPWQSVDAAMQKINDCVVMGSSINWVAANDGTSQDYISLGETGARRQFVVDYLAGRHIPNPINDSIVFANGTYRPSSQLVLHSAPVGVRMSGSGATEFRLASVLSGSWTNPDGAYPLLWRYSATVNVNGVPYAPGQVAFLPVFTTSLATAKTYLNISSWRCWVSPSGDLWVSLPSGVTPSGLVASTPGVWEFAIGSMPDFAGGIVDSIKVSGLTYVDYGAGPNERVGGAYGWSASNGSLTTVFKDCIAEGYTKHVMASVCSVAEGMVIYLRPRYGGQPPSLVDANSGIGTGDYSALVDYSSADSVDGNRINVYVDPDTSSAGFIASPGSAVGIARPSGQAPYITHTNGGPGRPFALTMFIFSGDCPDTYFGAGTPPVAKPITHQAFDLITNGYPRSFLRGSTASLLMSGAGSSKNKATRVYSPNLGKTYSQLRGTPPSILSKAHNTWITGLKEHREANCPLVRPKTYYFANAGDDVNGDGSQASPWKTVARCNAICSPLNGMRVNANTLTVAESSGFKVNGRSFWCGGFIRNNDGYFGPLFEIAGQIAVYSGSYSGEANFQRIWIQYWNSVSPTDFQTTLLAGNVADTWSFVQVWYDQATRVLSASVDNGTPRTVTLPSQLVASANVLRVGGGSFGNVYSGDYSRFFFVRDVVPTGAQCEAMHNGGKGLRSYTLGGLRTLFATNSGSFWDLNGMAGTMTYSDAISGQTLTRSTAQNSVVIPGPDADAAVSSTGGVITGGANIACLFKRGDKFTDAGLSSANHRANITIADYGSGNKPVLSLFTVPIANTWTLVSGTRYKRTNAAVGWVKKIGDDYLPFSLVLFKAGSAAECGATASSFFYDNAAGELHINVGADPATVSPSGWEGTARTPTLSHSIAGNFQRVENLILLGSGITEPGNASGYGLVVGGATGEEHVLKNLEVFYTGYHAIGHISTKAIGTWIGCKAGLCANRNETGTTGQAANGTIYVSFCGNGDQECVMWDCEVSHGPLPSYDWTGNDGMGGMLAHTAGSNFPALMLSYRTTYATTNHPCGYGTSFGTAESFAWAGQRAWCIEERIRAPYRSGFSVPSRYDAGGGVWSSVVTSGYRADLPITGSAGYLFGSRGYWLLNSTFEIDCAGYSNTFNIFGNVASNTAYVALGCRFSVTNTNGSGVVRIGDSSAVGAISGPWTNTVFTCGGTVAATRGTAPTTMFTNCAFFGMVGIGTNPVTLGSNPAILGTDPQLRGLGVSGQVEYDAGNLNRNANPSIGPWE